MSDSTRDQIGEFIRSELVIEADEVINNDTNLFSSSIIDSMNLLELVSFLEQTFSIAISPTELTLDHFDTVDRIADYVASKTA